MWWWAWWSATARAPSGQLAQERERDVEPVGQRPVVAHRLLVALGEVLAGRARLTGLEPRPQLVEFSLAAFAARAREIGRRPPARALLADADEHLARSRVVEPDRQAGREAQEPARSRREGDEHLTATSEHLAFIGHGAPPG